MTAIDGLKPDHRREYLAAGKISDPTFVLEGTTEVLGFPENPFDYAGYLARWGGLGTLPANRLGTKVAIIGAGTSGLCAAYELMKIGLEPVIYEATGRIGGRTWSKPAAGDAKVVLEMGAMRVPKSHLTFQFYAKAFEIQTGAFPNPGTVDTMLCFDGTRDVWKHGSPPPDYVRDLLSKLAFFFGPILTDLNLSQMPSMSRAEFVDRWRFWVERYQDVDFLEALLGGNRWSSRELAVLGAIGAGTGGLEAQFRSTVLELLRAALGGWDQDQLVIGGPCGRGIQSLADSFWSQSVATACGQRALRGLHAMPGEDASLRPAVVAIRATPSRCGVEITDASGDVQVYPAAILTCTTRAADMTIRIDDALFSEKVWRAIRTMHYVESTRILCRSREKFWHEGKICPVTLTDRATRATYLLDYGPDVESGVCLLSYTWGDDSTKFLALDKAEQVKLCLSVLDELYDGGFPRDQLDDFEAISWQQERGFHGGFKLTFPGQYEHNMALFNQYKENVQSGSKDGLFLAGEGVSWAGGWIEGALQSGLNAAFAVLRLLGGATAPES
jgi:lysine 2-monooxygenase